MLVSILILLDYLFLFSKVEFWKYFSCQLFQSLFYWITYSYLNLSFSDKLKSLLFQSLFYWITYSYKLHNTLKWKGTKWFQSLFYWITYSYSIYCDTTFFNYILFQSLFYWITYSYPFCRENPLFIIATEFFSDIKINFFLIFLVIFCWFFTIFRNS